MPNSRINCDPLRRHGGECARTSHYDLLPDFRPVENGGIRAANIKTE
jgi:hypothetical protein